MDLITIVTNELRARGMQPHLAAPFAKELFSGFTLMCIEQYAKQKFKEGCKAQRVICSKAPLLESYGTKLGLELTKAIQKEVESAPEPAYR